MVNRRWRNLAQVPTVNSARKHDVEFSSKAGPANLRTVTNRIRWESL
jgi:hypothetical protein